MPTQKMRELCTRIAAEKDFTKLNALVEELIKLLDADQEAIRAQIRTQIFGQQKSQGK